MIETIVKRDGRLVPFDPRKITFAILRAAVAVGGRDQELAGRIADRVVAELERRRDQAAGESPPSVPSVEEVQDTVEKMLIEGGHAKTAKAYILYRYEHSLRRSKKESLTYSSENVPYRKLWEALSWALDNRCHSLAGLGEALREGRLPQLARACEDFYAREIQALLDGLLENLEALRLLIIAGPSSSGKTTTTIKIAQALEERGKRLVPINADNYFFDRHTHPKDPFGDYDFETPQALDLALLNEHLRRLIAGDAVDIPSYNFKTGRRDGLAGELRLGPGDILLVDSLHGLYEPLSESVPAEAKYKIYIETLAQIKDSSGAFIRWTDVRMMRRMVRDMQFRGASPRQTLLHWYLVRRSELRYIVPRLRLAGAIVNSFMPYELLFLKARLAPYFPGFIQELSGNPDRGDALARAERISGLFSQIPDWNDESLVPPESLLREFIGGSSYQYH
ncbi:MAG: response regulator SirA [Spirochaetia bacterium]|jgi:uridine kinase|nr:response regulator SirA [Spirochaetia bacterium]